MVRHKIGRGPYLCRSQVGDDVQISASDAFSEMDGRKSRHIGEVLEGYRGEDAGESQEN